MSHLPNTGSPGECHVTPFDLRILSVIRQSAEGAATSVTLAQIGLKLNTHRQMIHRGMKRLVAGGYVTRQRVGRGSLTTVIRDDNGMTIGMTVPAPDDNGMTIEKPRDDNRKSLIELDIAGRDDNGMTVAVPPPEEAKEFAPPTKKPLPRPLKKKGLPHTPSKEKITPTPTKENIPPHSEKPFPRKGDDTTCQVVLPGPTEGEKLSAYLRRTAPTDPQINGVHATWAFEAFRLRAKQLGLPAPRPTGLTPSRKQLLQARLREHGVDGWMTALKNLETPFLRGDNDRGWQANLDFVLQASSFCKLVENCYKGKSSGYSYI